SGRPRRIGAHLRVVLAELRRQSAETPRRRREATRRAGEDDPITVEGARFVEAARAELRITRDVLRRAHDGARETPQLHPLADVAGAPRRAPEVEAVEQRLGASPALLGVVPAG